ncbi:MAG TPA: inorganic phosphate transporter [Patescibacteria group bacterium]|nr:inorganic phosphate transporter [Patescibacteria group bacterium]
MLPGYWFESHFVVVVVIFALLFDFINGFHDTANAIATSVTTQALKPYQAIIMAAVLNFTGALISTGVAKTIGGDIVTNASMINQSVIIAALTGAILWNLLTWWFGIPSSSSHALIGGILGALIVGVGLQAINFPEVQIIILSLVLSPLFALATGYLVMGTINFFFGRMKPEKMNGRFKSLQILSAAAASFSHGANDAQKSMGIITLALLSAGTISTFSVPTWVKICCALAMALGTSVGGWKIIKTMGGKITKLNPMSGFSADLNTSVVIMVATVLHLPVSTTHVVSGSIMGVGANKRIKAVNWTTAQQMLMAWCITIPFSAIASGVTYKVLSFLFYGV